MITTLAVENYRSLRKLIVPLGRLTVVTGANGTGKSSLYRALRLLADSARGGAVAALAREGGLRSTLWAGPETTGRAVREGRYRYLLWVAALLTPRPPSLMVLNEPETSLHPDLLDPLADLILTASRDTQTVVVTHASPLADALAAGVRRHRVDLRSVGLIKEFGQTEVAGRESALDEPLWYWPKR